MITPTTEMNIRQFPAELKRALKSLAASKGVSLREYVIRILQDHLRRIEQKAA